MLKIKKVWVTLMLCLCIGGGIALGGNAVAEPPEAKPSAATSGAGDDARPGPGNGLVTVNGSGGGTLQLRGFEGDTVSFKVQASAQADTPWAAKGSFEVTHVRPDGTILADFGGTVDCLIEGADVAVVSGTITRGSASLPGDEIGHRVGITVADHGRRDHLGWSWLVMQFHDAPPCTSTAPFFPVDVGNFRVDAR